VRAFLQGATLKLVNAKGLGERHKGVVRANRFGEHWTPFIWWTPVVIV